MRTQNLKNYLKLLVDFDSSTDDFKLKADEFVRVKAIKQRENDRPLIKTWYIKTVAELEDIIKKYKYNWNLYIGTCTTKGENETAEYMMARKVLFLDFDKKDYPQYDDVKDFCNHIKRILQFIFYHCVVDSGNGFHFYFAIQKTVDIDRVTRINKNLCKVLGADPEAVLTTQLARLPTSLNLKHDSKLVNIITNNYGSPQFKPYSLNKLEKIISYAKQSSKVKEVQQLPPKEYNAVSSYYCVEKMISEGVQQGERNFCLGRIVKYLQTIRGYNYNNALKLVLEWNQRCRPPKSVNEIAADFKRYWESDYKLLGCKLEDKVHQSILNRYCDKYNCKTVYDNSPAKLKTKEISIDNHLLQNRVIKKLRGNHYLILSVLHLHDEGLTYKQLQEEITNPTTQKCCLARNTLKTVLGDLIFKGYIACDGHGTYRLIKIPNYGQGYTRYYYAATILLINGIIKQQDYLVYLCLVRNLQQDKDVSYDTLSNDTGISKGHICEHIQHLFKSKILDVEKSYTDKGILCNTYTLIA